MKCPFCGYAESKVIDSRPAEEGNTIRRRRECLACGKRFTGLARSINPIFTTADGDTVYAVSIGPEEEKITANLSAVGALSAQLLQEAITDAIESELQGGLEREITTAEIGEMVMERLKELDEVAYVRFASVYRQFKDINTFMEELTKLLGDKTAQS